MRTKKKGIIMDVTLSDNTMQKMKNADVKTFTFNGKPQDPFSTWLVEGIESSFKEQGYHYLNDANETINIVFNLTDKENPQPFRRKSQGTFVVSIIETGEEPSDDVLKEAYPYLIRTVSNHVLYIVRTENNTDIYSITPEQGRYKITIEDQSSDDKLFDTIYKRLEPLASSQLVINNLFHDDLPEELWEGDEVTNSLRESGKKLDKLNLLPAPFPLEDFLTKRDIRHLKKLYGIGGLSYGNLSARKDGDHF
jgi:ribulose-5-phosphate 4-epimerase/fuculose-1-phosphate aldolase